MNRTRLAIVSAALVAAPLIGMGCEDSATTEALKTCSANLESAQKASSAQESTLKEMKKQLAEAQGKIGVLTKENEDLKAGKAQAKTDAKKSDAGDKKSVTPKGKKN